MILSFISALLSPDTEEKITVKPKSILHIDNLSIIDDRNSKPSDLKFNFENGRFSPLNKQIHCLFPKI